MNKKGFTLIELLTVFIIIGILAAIALPQYVSTLEKARSAEATVNVGSLRMAMHRHWYEQRAMLFEYYPVAFDTLDIDNPNNNTNRFFNYYLKDNSTKEAKNYTIRAERIGFPQLYWIQWAQINNNTGRFTRSNALGGPEK